MLPKSLRALSQDKQPWIACLPFLKGFKSWMWLFPKNSVSSVDYLLSMLRVILGMIFGLGAIFIWVPGKFVKGMITALMVMTRLWSLVRPILNSGCRIWDASALAWASVFLSVKLSSAAGNEVTDHTESIQDVLRSGVQKMLRFFILVFGPQPVVLRNYSWQGSGDHTWC